MSNLQVINKEGLEHIQLLNLTKYKRWILMAFQSI